jgi:hypothetical protein
MIEGAAGTGLTGESEQEFVPIAVGQLESEATVIRLRLVIGAEAALDTPEPQRARQAPDEAPLRPAARP